MQSLNVLLKDVMTGAVYKDLDLLACINFANVLKTSTSGVLQIVSPFRRIGAATRGPEAGEVSCGGVTAVVAKLNGALQKYDEPPSRPTGLTRVEAVEQIGCKDLWYGIVDGSNQYLTILSLMNSE